MANVKLIARIVLTILTCLALLLCIIPVALVGQVVSTAVNFLPHQISKKVIRYNEIVKVYLKKKEETNFPNINLDYSFESRPKAKGDMIQKEGEWTEFISKLPGVEEPEKYTGAYVEGKDYGPFISVPFNTRQEVEVQLDLVKGTSRNSATAKLALFTAQRKTDTLKSTCETNYKGKYVGNYTCETISALDKLCVLVDPANLNFQDYEEVIKEYLPTLSPKSMKVKSQIQQTRQQKKSRTLNPTTHGCHLGNKFNIAMYKYISYETYFGKNVSYSASLSELQVREALDPALFYEYDTINPLGWFAAFLELIPQSLNLIGVAAVLFVILCVALIVLDCLYCFTCCLPERKPNYQQV